MIVVENGSVFDSRTNTFVPFDVVIDQGKIIALERPGTAKHAEGAQRIDARGQWVVPGLVDLHVHLREPGFEWKETVATGVRAAVVGGYTTVCCMPNTKPSNDHAEITQFIRERAAAAGLAKVLPIGAVSVGLQGKEMAPLSELRKAGCVAFSDDGEPIFDAGLMRRALEWATNLGAVISCHEEDKCLSAGGVMNESARSYRLGLKGWPKVAEEVMIARDIELARACKARVHLCHVSTARGVELVRRAKNDGILVTAEVTPHHLTLTEAAVGDYDTNAKMSPPLREDEDVAALRAGLADGTIDAIASDHAPHDLDSKRVEFGKASFGILGLQTSLSLAIGLVREGCLTKERAIEALSTGPSRAFGLEAGALRPGAVADVAIINPDVSWRFAEDAVLSRSRNTPFLGRELFGRADTVLVDGRVVVAGQCVVNDNEQAQNA